MREQFPWRPAPAGVREDRTFDLEYIKAHPLPAGWSLSDDRKEIVLPRGGDGHIRVAWSVCEAWIARLYGCKTRARLYGPDNARTIELPIWERTLNDAALRAYWIWCALFLPLSEEDE